MFVIQDVWVWPIETFQHIFYRIGVMRPEIFSGWIESRLLALN